MGQRRVAGAKIVNGQLDPVVLQLLEDIERATVLLHDNALGNLQFQPVRLAAVFLQDLLYGRYDLIVFQLVAGEVDGDSSRIEIRLMPLSYLSARRL